MAQANAALTSSNMEVMEQLEHMPVTVNVMKAQLKGIALTPKNQTRSNRKY